MPDMREIATDMMTTAELELSPEELEFVTTSAYRYPETWAPSTSTLYSSKVLGRALEKHAAALIQSAEAAKEHTARLATATLVLAGASIVLAFLTFVLVISMVVSLWMT